MESYSEGELTWIYGPGSIIIGHQERTGIKMVTPIVFNTSFYCKTDYRLLF